MVQHPPAASTAMMAVVVLADMFAKHVEHAPRVALGTVPVAMSIKHSSILRYSFDLSK
jgi:hypothetical protein